MLFSIAVLPVSSNLISETENIDACIEETVVKVFYILKFDFSGKGEAVWEDALLKINLTEGEAATFALYSYKIDKDGIKGRCFFASYTITSPAAGFLGFFRGTVDYDPETKIMEIHGFAIFGISDP